MFIYLFSFFINSVVQLEHKKAYRRYCGEKKLVEKSPFNIFQAAAPDVYSIQVTSYKLNIDNGPIQ